jgi:hypothetical protein
MEIIFEGKITKSTEILIKDLIEYVCNKFLNKRQINSIKIEVELHNYEKIDGMNAQMYIDDVSYKNYPKSYVFELATKIPLFRLLISVAHECVHLKQYVLKEMKDKNDGIVEFLGKDYKLNSMEYHDYPWEIEAHGREIFLVLHYLKSKNLHLEPWVPEEVY